MSAKPGVEDSGNCLYCKWDLDLQTFAPCSHVICGTCRDGATPSLVRVVSPHADIEAHVDADQQNESGPCLFCHAILRTSMASQDTLDILRCACCGGVSQEAHEGECGHCMCEACAQYVCRTTCVCPACEKPLNPEQMRPNRLVIRVVNDLKYQCKFELYGCEERGTIEELMLHERQCEYDVRVCSKCGMRVRPEQWQQHVERCNTNKGSAQVEAQQQLIQLLQTQIQEQNETIQALQGELEEQIEKNHYLQSQMQEQNQVMQQLQKELEQKVEKNQSLRCSLQEKLETIQGLQTEVARLQLQQDQPTQSTTGRNLPQPHSICS
eukprot:TRINITY_DN17374_c0_g2_i1.p1 TRINITY_DN17374_c0_g2~~TRINITY_DN17374_c0_g2_i1.p1  ORF type:complete len:324 (-),score=36.49 TRINITY_DN17374_c0_g2_i1:232-1203(-)